MRITKLHAPWSPQFWSPKFQSRYNLEQYNPNRDRNEPVIVFGCYGGGTKNDIMNHSGLCVIVWSGSDSVRLHEQGGFVRYCRDNSDRVFHIAHSHWIQTDLKHWGLDYIDRVVIPTDLSSYQFEETPGEAVYHYGTHQRTWYYGTHLMKNIEKKWNKNKRYPKIIITTQAAFNKEELYNVYKNSFIGVRLTEHDNMAMSVVEMGLMGRRSIFNGNVPCAIPYPCEPYDRYEPLTRKQWVWQDQSLTGVIERMILENQDYPNRLVADEMREFVHDDEKWLNTEFYEN